METYSQFRKNSKTGLEVEISTVILNYFPQITGKMLGFETSLVQSLTTDILLSYYNSLELLALDPDYAIGFGERTISGIDEIIFKALGPVGANLEKCSVRVALILIDHLIMFGLMRGKEDECRSEGR